MEREKNELRYLMSIFQITCSCGKIYISFILCIISVVAALTKNAGPRGDTIQGTAGKEERLEGGIKQLGESE